MNEGLSRLCTPDRIRTCDPRLRRPMLYPAELPGQIKKSIPNTNNDACIVSDNYFIDSRLENIKQLINIIPFTNWVMEQSAVNLAIFQNIITLRFQSNQFG